MSDRVSEEANYHARVIAEKRIFEECVHVHNLPAIFHYWSNRYVRPKLERFGFSGPNAFFQKYLEEQCDRRKNGALHFVSIGCGNCDLEIELVRHLRTKGHKDFVIDCVDLNSVMLERGRISSVNEGVADYVRFIEEDFNHWSPAHEYDVVIANQALHHVLNLERLFARIKSSLKPAGLFVISDIIGRNGHQRWPEALDIVHEFWRKLPPSYRFNRQLDRYEELYEDWDCSYESFEGIRSQDILALLLEHFRFQLFIAYANVIDPFVDRSFGPNFDASALWDRAFIDQVNERDDNEINAGRVKPTHMLAVVGNNLYKQVSLLEPLTPEFCLRSAGAAKQAVASPQINPSPPGAYEWHTWPHSAQRELEIACQRLAGAENRIKHFRERADQQDKELEDRTVWARRIEKELEDRTAWALQLEKELEDRTALALRLRGEFEDRSAWALQLNQELERLHYETKYLGWARRLVRRLRTFSAK
jgi:SAM-dependent methyltransferase